MVGTMILKMTAATALYVIATILLWLAWRKGKEHTTGQKLAVGLFYGLCSVAANHIGIDYGEMILNVRDIGPLAAGLFFSPISGIVGGLIGGIERYLVGEYLNIGYFTRVACGISTCLAGFLSAGLNRAIYKGKRPSVIHCLFLGAEMEVFHMYAIFITNRANMQAASEVVRACALPMITFTGIGLMGCCLIISLLSGTKFRLKLRTPKKDTTIDVRFQRWLLIATVSLFGLSAVLNYSLQTHAVYQGMNRDSQMMETLFLEIMIFTALYLLITTLVERMIVRNLERVNESLERITAGKLDETVQVEESIEFTKLSEDINTTVSALRGYISEAENRMQKDLQLAAAIQEAALPRNFRLPSASIEIYALMTPARYVGGDFYDFFYIRRDLIAMVIADVSGKGVPASLFMMQAKNAIKNNARSGLGPAKMLEAVNNALCEGNDAEMFVTVWVGMLDLGTGLMHCANAGHEYPAVMRAGGDYELLRDDPHGMVLAEFEDMPMHEYEVQLHPGDRFFVYTDGVPEAVNPGMEQYGTDRMTAHLNTLKDASQQETLTEMLADIRRFAGEAEQFDDITMMGVTFKG